jgi:hypothetical protein
MIQVKRISKRAQSSVAVHKYDAHDVRVRCHQCILSIVKSSQMPPKALPPPQLLHCDHAGLAFPAPAAVQLPRKFA